MTEPTPQPTHEGERIAKVLARAGLCSRREAERWIEAGRVEVNGRRLSSPALDVGPKDRIVVDGVVLPERERTRLFLFHKPRGLVTTAHDPQGRKTVFEALPPELPRVIAVGRLDINTEGLLLLTNDGGLARLLELPATGWLRRYRVRAHGFVTQQRLNELRDGIALDGVLYGAIEASVERQQGDNIWLSVGLREGKNREVKRILEHLGLAVNRLIRVSYGPFQLSDMPAGAVIEVKRKTLRQQLGERLAEAAGVDFEAPVRPPPRPAPPPPPEKKTRDARKPSEGKKPSEGRKPSEARKPLDTKRPYEGKKPYEGKRTDEAKKPYEARGARKDGKPGPGGKGREDRPRGPVKPRGERKGRSADRRR